jgi:FlaA1/EpsC-like NDP-sugar epimerase
MRDLVSLITAVTVSSALSVGLLFMIFRLETYPRSVFIIDWFVVLVLAGGARFAYRLYRDWHLKSAVPASSHVENVLIVGAGRAGELILREILGNYRLRYNPVGFVDDNRSKRNLTIHGYRVMGNTRDIPRLVEKYGIDEIFLAVPSAPAKARRRIMLLCKKAQVKFKTLPSVGELLRGTVTVSALREFQIEDLLGREPARLDTAAIREYVRDKTVLITGAGGSIGSELCRQVAQYAPRRLVLYEQSEFNLYQIEMNLEEVFPDIEVHPVVGDILNQPRVEQTFKQFSPEVVFHAAAYKHVPLMEKNPEEALRNNAFGTWTMAHLAQLYGVRKFVMVSTDKAVRPTNIMGASKRIAELICEGFGRKSATKFVTVRFGNVLNSVGSVIPLFKRQIAAGGPVTVTHPEIYRYFMTIPESVQLILQAGAMGQGGEIFILDMGELVRIVDLARDMITLSGLEPGKDVKIVFTGLRPGEKMYEELLTEGEEVKSTLHEKIKIAKAASVDWQALLDKIERLIDMLRCGSPSDIVNKIKEIIPEFQPEKGGPGNSMPPLQNADNDGLNPAVLPDNSKLP